jgi:hypothetical protein
MLMTMMNADDEENDGNNENDVNDISVYGF